MKFSGLLAPLVLLPFGELSYATAALRCSSQGVQFSRNIHVHRGRNGRTLLTRALRRASAAIYNQICNAVVTYRWRPAAPAPAANIGRAPSVAASASARGGPRARDPAGGLVRAQPRIDRDPRGTTTTLRRARVCVASPPQRRPHAVPAFRVSTLESHRTIWIS